MRAFALVTVILLMPSITDAASGPRWSPSELVDFADVVVTGRVTAVTSGWDHQVNAIYTYVTVDVAEVLKGGITGDRITVKQLGGAADGIMLSVTDQASFHVGQDVLLYLEARPRDGTLYTSALWQGKWDLQRGARGQQVAVRSAPMRHAQAVEQQLLSDVRVSAAGSTRAEGVQLTPYVADTATAAADGGFRLLGPYRYVHSPSVETQVGGQPGLIGGGFAEIRSAVSRWNSAGTSFRFVPGGTNAAPRCSGELLGDGRVTISFMDPCGEMADTGATLSIGGSYFVPGGGGTSNGQSFDRALEGFIVNNDSPLALSYLTNRGCFEELQTHELGHVLGLNHSSDPMALMYEKIDSETCKNGARGLMRDDVEGIAFIYGRSSSGFGAAPPMSAPTDVRVAIQPSSLTVSWTAIPFDAASSDATATSYRIDFRAGHSDQGAIVASSTTSGTSLTVAVPPDVAGDFNVIVSAITAAGTGPASERRDFSLRASGATCATAPSPVTTLTGAVTGGIASVQWSPVNSATRYLIQAGTSPGMADLFALTDLGALTQASASVPNGFRGWVRVIAANTCGLSAPADVLLQ